MDFVKEEIGCAEHRFVIKVTMWLSLIFIIIFIITAVDFLLVLLFLSLTLFPSLSSK